MTWAKVEDLDWSKLIYKVCTEYEVLLKGTMRIPESLEEAFHLSIAKWHPDNPHRGNLCCGLCLFYSDDCSKCAFNLGYTIGCSHDLHYWSIWEAFMDTDYHDEAEITRAADDVYKALVRAYEEHPENA